MVLAMATSELIGSNLSISEMYFPNPFMGI